MRSSEDPRIKYLKFIMVTGSNEKVLEAMEEGANNFIHKPFTADGIDQKLSLIFN